MSSLACAIALFSTPFPAVLAPVRDATGEATAPLFSPFTTPARRVLELAAERMPCFFASDVIYNREPHSGVSGVQFRRELLEAWQSVFETPFSRMELLDLLAHRDPRIRTLAAARLFHEEDPHLVPCLAPLLDDVEPTFAQPTFGEALPMHGLPEDARPVLLPQTVGSVVQQFFAAYPRRAGIHRVEEQLDYWTQRSDREHCLSWFSVRLDRATHGMWPAHPDRLGLMLLRDEIGALPPAERDWTLLALFHQLHNTFCDVVTSDRRLASELWLVHESELLFAARRRGRDALLEVLRGAPPIGDPDLPAYIEGIQHFVLEHATELLAPEDAEELVRIGAERTSATPLPWHSAAARLRPADARRLLLEGLDEADDSRAAFRRARLGIDLWRSDDVASAGAIRDWFFAPDPRGVIPPKRLELVELVCARWNGADRALLARIVRDERCNTLDPWTLGAIARGLNQNWPELLVSATERELWGGTEVSVDVLAGWLEQIRASVPSWFE